MAAINSFDYDRKNNYRSYKSNETYYDENYNSKYLEILSRDKELETKKLLDNLTKTVHHQAREIAVLKELNKVLNKNIDELTLSEKKLSEENIELLKTIKELQAEVDKIHSRFEIMDL
jgi:hypothetical protein